MRRLMLAAVAALTLALPASYADTFYFSGSGGLAAKADVTWNSSTGAVTVVLTNTSANSGETNNAQIFTGLFFNVTQNGSPVLLSGTTTSASVTSGSTIIHGSTPDLNNNWAFRNDITGAFGGQT